MEKSRCIYSPLKTGFCSRYKKSADLKSYLIYLVWHIQKLPKRWICTKLNLYAKIHRINTTESTHLNFETNITHTACQRLLPSGSCTRNVNLKRAAFTPHSQWKLIWLVNSGQTTFDWLLLWCSTTNIFGVYERQKLISFAYSVHSVAKYTILRENRVADGNLQENQ